MPVSITNRKTFNKVSTETAGLPAGWTPVQTLAGGFSINSSQVIEDWLITSGSLAVVNNATVTLRRCRIVGPGGDYYGIENNYGNLTLEHCEFDGAFSAAAIRGYNITASWCEMKNLPADAVKIENNNTITDCLLHQFTPANGSHTDGMQMETPAGNVQILRNTIIVAGAGDPYINDTTGCLLLNPELASSYGPRAPGDIIVDGNYFSGGADTVHLSSAAYPLTGVRFRNNVFVNNALYGAVYPSGYVCDEWSNNTYVGGGIVAPPA